MINLAPIATTVAATLAAIFAGLNLYVSGKREHVKWAREALVDTFIGFLTASFDHKDVCKRISGMPAAAEPTGDLKALVERTEVLHDLMKSYVTRLRVLTTAEVADAAWRLHEHNDRYYDLVMRASGRPSPDEDEAARRAFDDDRNALVQAAKRVLAIR